MSVTINNLVKILEKETLHDWQFESSSKLPDGKFHNNYSITTSCQQLVDRQDNAIFIFTQPCMFQSEVLYKESQISVDSYEIKVFPIKPLDLADMQPKGDSPLGKQVILLASAPTTTEGSHSQTSSMSHTFSISGGMFGGTPTGSLGYSATWSNSESMTLPNVDIENLCMTNKFGNNVGWRYAFPMVNGQVTAGSHAGTSAYNQWIWQIKRDELAACLCGGYLWARVEFIVKYRMQVMPPKFSIPLWVKIFAPEVWGLDYAIWKAKDHPSYPVITSNPQVHYLRVEPSDEKKILATLESAIKEANSAAAGLT